MDSQVFERVRQIRAERARQADSESVQETEARWHHELHIASLMCRGPEAGLRRDAKHNWLRRKPRLSDGTTKANRRKPKVENGKVVGVTENVSQKNLEAFGKLRAYLDAPAETTPYHLQ